MQEFAYTARNMAGQDVSGLITAESRNDVMAMLAEKSLFPLDVNPANGGGLKLNFKRGINTELLTNTLTQLSDLLANGVPLLQALEVMIQQVERARAQRDSAAVPEDDAP